MLNYSQTVNVLLYSKAVEPTTYRSIIESARADWSPNHNLWGCLGEVDTDLTYNRGMAHPVIHISEAEAASDFASVLARVRAGAEIVIESESGKLPVAVIHSPVPPRRSISECIALARKHEEETGESPVLDPDFTADVEEHHPQPQALIPGLKIVSL